MDSSHVFKMAGSPVSVPEQDTELADQTKPTWKAQTTMFTTQTEMNHINWRTRSRGETKTDSPGQPSGNQSAGTGRCISESLYQLVFTERTFFFTEAEFGCQYYT